MDKLRVVVAGCGSISGLWFNAMKDRTDAEVVGLMDISREAAGKRATDFNLSQAVIETDLATVLEKTKPDAVFDCTIPEAHKSVTLTALRHGCHVLGEKPMSDTMANAREMLHAAKAAGRTYAVMQNRRYLPGIIAAKQFLDSGRIGRITTVHCDFFLAPHFGGFRDKMQHPLLLDMSIHTFDQARYLTGRSPLTAMAHAWNPPGSWYAGDASAVAIFEMNHDTVYCYRGSWCSEGMNTTWECAWRFIGDKGTMTWDGGETFHAQIVTEEPGFSRKTTDLAVPFDREAVKHQGHAGCIDEFIRCVLEERTPQTVCTDNIQSLSMVHGAIAAAAQGRRVACETV
ncbi:MAG: Gfo/Idh/MocA family oxidoreductase [Phycisphaeraceae bacterium]|nr:Gfo/Idh/MocA family oxidoreductase [Phycisphaeraceae bacterium]